MREKQMGVCTALIAYQLSLAFLTRLCIASHWCRSTHMPNKHFVSFTGADDEDIDEVAVLTQALSSALCTHAEMLLQKAVAERDAAAEVCVYKGLRNEY